MHGPVQSRETVPLKRRLHRKYLGAYGENAKRTLPNSPNTPRDRKLSLSRRNFYQNQKYFTLVDLRSSIVYREDRISKKTISRYCPFKKTVRTLLALYNIRPLVKIYGTHCAPVPLTPGVDREGEGVTLDGRKVCKRSIHGG